MGSVGQPERATQERVVDLFESLGYDYRGDWRGRPGNANVEVSLLAANLRARGYSEELVGKAIAKLQSDASLGGGRDLYEANRDVYTLLRYGVKIKTGQDQDTETVWLIDWQDPESNHFAFAEEVTVQGRNSKRPDIVLYVNGIALATLELKRSKVHIEKGIRQTIGNQKREYIRPFFTTVQLLLAGNDVEGLRYGVIEASEKYWLKWKEPSAIEQPLDRDLTQLCAKERLLEIIHDFMVFDAGVKKTCRHNQFFGVRAAQERVARREGGILWHTQGSGKSLIMVWLAKWLRDHQPNARVLIVTDRDELDDQIKKVFAGVEEQIYRTKSGADLLSVLNDPREWLVCSLVHKFGSSGTRKDQETDAFIRELGTQVPQDFQTKGNLFVFVDEAHRTQSGTLHDAMKKLLPGAMFIGFTGTPLLKTDKQTTMQRFGGFIHTYKFDEAKADGVVLDLRYEARNIDQDLTSPERVDRWFEAKTRGMTDLSRAELKKRWGTVQKALTAEPRTRQIVDDILIDMETLPRLSGDGNEPGKGNAILVTSSVYQACRYYELFSQADLKGKCAIVTSYVPQFSDVSQEDSGHGQTEKQFKYDVYRRMLADHFDEPADQAMRRVEEFEDTIKERFINEPGRMKLLIVVDKLLTGFDAPSATYLYIDKPMRDHGLFQAICRVNRIDGEDKTYGCVIDYRDLFNSLRSAISDYTGDAFDGYDREDTDGLLTDRIGEGRLRLEEALERLRGVCEPVDPPKHTLDYLRYFCGGGDRLKQTEQRRVELYKAVTTATRAYAAIANDMVEAGYTADEAIGIKTEIKHYVDVRAEVKLGAGENVDFKRHEAGMRHLLDTYISAAPSEVVANFGETGLIELIGELGGSAVEKLPDGIRNDPEAVSETIVNNIRKVIIDEHALNPKYYDKMSQILDNLLEERRREAVDYKTFLDRLIEHAADLGEQGSGGDYPAWADSPARRALIDFGFHAELAIAVDDAVTRHRPDGWVGHPIKERMVERALRRVLPGDFDRFSELFNLVKEQLEYS